MSLDLHWLPPDADWTAKIKLLEPQGHEAPWPALQALSKTRIDFLQTIRLDRLLRRAAPTPPGALPTSPVRLALLGSATVDHLAPAIRVALLRRNLWAEIYLPAFGQQQQELLDPTSGLAQFHPTHILFAQDAAHLCAGLDATTATDFTQTTLHGLRANWQRAQSLGARVLQQTPLPVFPPLLGNNEHRLPGSKARFIAQLAATLRQEADTNGVDLIAIDDKAARDGLHAWHNPALYHRGKYEIAPDAAPMYGDLVARIVAAQQGLSAKCLVLDLDNTIWGGVIGDDGLHGIVLGQGNAAGEAFAAVQTYARDLARRGIILAICSKNDEANARAAFREHPEMVLRETDIACFVANWDDKATNLRTIAKRLNIGLDALVFLDDNPFERNLIRAELPMLAVPEIDPDPATFPTTLADAGYFEATTLTQEDLHRTRQYQANTARDAAQHALTDLPAYLRSLAMRLTWRPFDAAGLPRIVQLINKTNQFNLTTRRYTQPEAEQLATDPQTLTLQLRLTDRFGDNGMIAVIIARLTPARELHIDTWLMSCRVLGRTVEQATLALLAHQAAALGATALLGEYRPTPKNDMVRGHYGRLGFERIDETPQGGTIYRLPLPHTARGPAYISIEGP